MTKRFIFECDDYTVWEVEEVIWLNADGSYTLTYPNNIHILESRINEGKNFIFLKYHWTQAKCKGENMQSPFRKKEKVFNSLGISLYDNEGQFRKTYEVLSDLSEAWKGLNEIQQEYYAQELFRLF